MRMICLALGVSLWTSLTNGYAYDWQKHIPEEAKRYIPNGEDGQNSSSVGVKSLQGKVTLTSHAGPLKLMDAQVVSPLNVFGPLTAHHSDFLDLLTCHGPLELIGQQNWVKKNMEVYGPVVAQGMNFEKNVTIYGPLTATRCIFKAPIRSYTSTISFKDSEILDLIINDKEGTSAVIELDNVKVEGRITVASGQGKLIVKNSKLNEKLISGVAHFDQQ